MNIIRVTQLATITICAAAFLCACRTATPYRQADRTSDRITSFRDEAISMQQSIANTVIALDELVEQANVNPRDAYQQLTRAVEGAERANQTASRRAEDMRAEGKVFFEQWQQDVATIGNPEMRELAEERRATLERNFRNISYLTLEVRDELRPWLDNVRDLHTLLGRDLTPAGIKSARSLIATTKNEGAQLTLTYDNLIDELNAVIGVITPARGPTR
jgi:hypothetical protein